MGGNPSNLPMPSLQKGPNGSTGGQAISALEPPPTTPPSMARPPPIPPSAAEGSGPRGEEHGDRHDLSTSISPSDSSCQLEKVLSCRTITLAAEVGGRGDSGGRLRGGGTLR